LATVVIGGLISATLLTLFVLPTLYARFGRRELPAPSGKHIELPPSAHDSVRA
jgi:cobalt-zinc-cadmium resistance protein CzcA